MKRRPLSVGSKVMLVTVAVVLVASAVVLGRLSSGASVDLNKLNMQSLDLFSGERDGENDSRQSAAAAENPSGYPEAPGSGATVAEKTAQNGNNAEKAQTTQNSDKTATGESGATKPTGSGKSDKQPGTDSYTLAVAGSVCLEDEVLKNAWNTDSKAYDLSDTMMLLKPEMQADLSAVFLENIITDNSKANGVVAPEALADLLQEAGFGIAACGFSKAYDKGEEGIAGTWIAMDERGIFPTGIRTEDRQETLEIKTVNGVKTAFLQYTGTVPAKTRKKMAGAGMTRTVPEVEISLIAEEINTARKQGAEAVIVMLKWGKTDNKPDNGQRELAAQIAKAGADLIIGSGSRIPQGAEYLEGQDGAKVLCVWSLGTLLTGDRTNVKHMAGYILHVTVRKNGKGGADILAPEYSPVYTWKYKQDGRYYYRCLAADQPAPDGMDGEQQKTMAKAEKTVSEILSGSPVTLRTR